MAKNKQQQEQPPKQYRRVYRPKKGVDYSAVLDGKRRIVRLVERLDKDDWMIRVVETDEEWHINPKTLESAEPE